MAVSRCAGRLLRRSGEMRCRNKPVARPVTHKRPRPPAGGVYKSAVYAACPSRREKAITAAYWPSSKNAALSGTDSASVTPV